MFGRKKRPSLDPALVEAEGQAGGDDVMDGGVPILPVTSEDEEDAPNVPAVSDVPVPAGIPLPGQGNRGLLRYADVRNPERLEDKLAHG